MQRHIALGGHRNADYLSEPEAQEHGYVLVQWSENEEAWLHTTNSLEEPPELDDA